MLLAADAAVLTHRLQATQSSSSKASYVALIQGALGPTAAWAQGKRCVCCFCGRNFPALFLGEKRFCLLFLLFLFCPPPPSNFPFLREKEIRGGKWICFFPVWSGVWPGVTEPNRFLPFWGGKIRSYSQTEASFRVFNGEKPRR